MYPIRVKLTPEPPAPVKPCPSLQVAVPLIPRAPPRALAVALRQGPALHCGTEPAHATCPWTLAGRGAARGEVHSGTEPQLGLLEVPITD